MAKLSHAIERRRFQWKRWAGASLAVLAVAVPMYSAWKDNQNQIKSARDTAQEQHTAAQVDRAVTHERISILENDVQFLMENRRCSP